MVIAPTRLDLFILGSKTMPGLLQRFLPRDDDYFQLFARQAENIQKGARALCDMLSRYTAVNEQVQSIKAIEHAGDEIAHTIITKLNQTYITPIDREDIHELRSEEHTSELQSRLHLVCRLLLEKKKKHIHNLLLLFHGLHTIRQILLATLHRYLHLVFHPKH